MHQKQQFYIKHTIACGHKHHKLTNLSIANGMDNVLAVISDKKLAVCSATNSIYYLIDVASATDYSPFGAPLPERQYTAGLQATHTVAADHFNGSTTGWQAHGANSVVSSYCGNLRAVITNRGSQGQGMKKTFATTPGQLYKVSFLINVMAWPALVITDPTTGAELLRTPTNMPGHYSYTFMAQSTHTTIAFEEIVATNSTILLCNFTLQEVGGGYAFGGAGGQQKDDEIFIGAYTAEFWEYDSRLGRRWNVDPVVNFNESPYSTFLNNPIFYIDPHGLSPEEPVKPKNRGLGNRLYNGWGYLSTWLGRIIGINRVWTYQPPKKKDNVEKAESKKSNEKKDKYDVLWVVFEDLNNGSFESDVQINYSKIQWAIPVKFKIPSSTMPENNRSETTLTLSTNSDGNKEKKYEVKDGELFNKVVLYEIDEFSFRQYNELDREQSHIALGNNPNGYKPTIHYRHRVMSKPILVKVPKGLFGIRNWKNRTLDYSLQQGDKIKNSLNKPKSKKW